MADRIHRHFFNGGALTPGGGARTLPAPQGRDRPRRRRRIRPLGRLQARHPPSPANDWLNAVNNVREQLHFPSARTAWSASSRRAAFTRPSSRPSFSQHGGAVPVGFQLTIQAPAGTIYYTVDGSDPRLRGGAVSPAARTPRAQPADGERNRHAQGPRPERHQLERAQRGRLHRRSRPTRICSSPRSCTTRRPTRRARRRRLRVHRTEERQPVRDRPQRRPLHQRHSATRSRPAPGSAPGSSWCWRAIADAFAARYPGRPARRRLSAAASTTRGERVTLVHAVGDARSSPSTTGTRRPGRRRPTARDSPSCPLIRTRTPTRMTPATGAPARRSAARRAATIPPLNVAAGGHQRAAHPHRPAADGRGRTAQPHRHCPPTSVTGT